jgi:hypothetical protein
VALVALFPLPTALDVGLTPVQVEAVLLSVLVFLGVQEAWVVTMTRPSAQPQD